MLTFDNRDYVTPSEHEYTLRDVVEGMGYDLGLQDYPIFDPDYRATLNQGIYDHFCFREVASETPSMFVFYLNRKLREVMPTYNAIYAKVREEGFDALADFSSAQNSTSDGTSSNTGTSKSDSTGDTYNSDTPQQILNDPTTITLANNLVRQSSGSTGTDDSSGTSHSDYVAKSTGYSGGIAKNVIDAIAARYMATDTLVYDALECCFMQLWNDANH